MKKNYINFIKFIAIIMVVTIHLISHGWNMESPDSVNFRVMTGIDSLCRVAVPLFAMCSGAIFLNRNDSYLKILGKYVLNLFVDFLIFNTLYLMAQNISSGTFSPIQIPRYFFQSLMLESAYHMWYLKEAMLMYMSIPVFRYFIEKKNFKTDTAVLLACFVLFFITPLFIKQPTYLEVIHFTFYLFYFFMGYYMEKYLNNVYDIIWIAVLIAGYVCTFQLTMQASLAAGYGIESPMDYGSVNVCAMALSVMGVCLKHRKLFDREKLSSFLNLENRYNYGVYLVHGAVIGALSILHVIQIEPFRQLFMLPVYLIITLILSFLGAFIWVRIREYFEESLKQRKRTA